MRPSYLLAGIVLALSLFAQPASAQNESALVMVPDGPSGGAVVAGCFVANQRLFGYNFTMCLRTRGTYTVSSGRRRCEGRLNWRVQGQNIAINIRRQSCGRGQVWEAASIDCRGRGILRNALDRIFGRGAHPFVMAPNTPAVRSLSCTYFPSVRGVRPVNFTANRR